jgi:hypothetical protein
MLGFISTLLSSERFSSLFAGLYGANDIIFYVASLSFSQWKRIFLSELQAVSLRVKPQVKDKIKDFLVDFCNSSPFLLGLRPCTMYIFLYK